MKEVVTKRHIVWTHVYGMSRIGNPIDKERRFMDSEREKRMEETVTANGFLDLFGGWL